jgi:transposase
MGSVRKTLRKVHETLKRARFRCLFKQGVLQAEAARIVDVNRITALKWLYQPSDRRNKGARTGRLYIILNEKVKEIIEWITGHFDRQAMPFPQILNVFNIKASKRALLRALARFGYHYHVPDCKPYLIYEYQLKR